MVQVKNRGTRFGQFMKLFIDVFQSQINLYNESCSNESLMDADRIVHHLSEWLMETKIIEHIFGPNLHIEVRAG